MKKRLTPKTVTEQSYINVSHCSAATVSLCAKTGSLGFGFDGAIEVVK